MAYITAANLKLRFPQFNSWNSGSETLINSFMIFYAEAELDSALASMYSVPFTPAHPTVKDLSMQFCRYRLYEDLDAEKAAHYKKIIDARIKDLREGKAFIYTESGTIIEPTGSGHEVWSSTDDYPPVHSMLDADSPYTEISSEYLDKLENDRS